MPLASNSHLWPLPEPTASRRLSPLFPLAYLAVVLGGAQNVASSAAAQTTISTSDVGGNVVGGDSYELGTKLTIQAQTLNFAFGSNTVHTEADASVAKALEADAAVHDRAVRVLGAILRRILDQQQHISASAIETQGALERGFEEVVEILRQQLAMGQSIVDALAAAEARLTVEVTLDIPHAVDCSNRDDASNCIRLSTYDAKIVVRVSSDASSSQGTVASRIVDVTFSCGDRAGDDLVFRPGVRSSSRGWISIAAHRRFNTGMGLHHSLDVRMGGVCVKGVVIARALTSQGFTVTREAAFTVRPSTIIYSRRDIGGTQWDSRHVPTLPFYYSDSLDRLEDHLDDVRVRPGHLAIVDGRYARNVVLALPAPPLAPPQVYRRAVEAQAWDLWAYRQLAREDRTLPDTYCSSVSHYLRRFAPSASPHSISFASWVERCDVALKAHLAFTVEDDRRPTHAEVYVRDAWEELSTMEQASDRGRLAESFALRYEDSDVLEFTRREETIPMLKIAGGAGIGIGNDYFFSIRPTFEADAPFAWGYANVGIVRMARTWAAILKANVHELLPPVFPGPIEFGIYAGGDDRGYLDVGIIAYAGLTVFSPRSSRVERRGAFEYHARTTYIPGLEVGFIQNLGVSSWSMSLVLRTTVGEQN